MVLSDRRQRVLSALIEEYVARALPVGSRTLVERYKLGVSSATVRNELSVLEDAGYIVQPHTSAGRIPTDIGYRAFVDDLLASGNLEEASNKPEIEAQIKQYASELDTLFQQTSAALARLTDCLSVVLAPSVLAFNLKQLSLVSLSDYQALIIIITEQGQVMNRHMEFAEPVAADDLARIQNFLNKAFVGKSMNRLVLGPEEKEALRDPLMQVVFDEILLCLQEDKSGRAHRLGISSLLRQPEFSQAQSLLPIMQILEDDTVLLHIFEDEALQSGPIVKIGSENSAEALSGVSMVAGRYGRGESAGVVAVIGPTRMDYSRVLQAVQAAQKVLQDN